MPGIPKDRAFEEGVLWRCLFASVSPTVGRNAEKNFELTICNNNRLSGKRLKTGCFRRGKDHLKRRPVRRQR